MPEQCFPPFLGRRMQKDARIAKGDGLLLVHSQPLPLLEEGSPHMSVECELVCGLQIKTDTTSTMECLKYC